jgi:hypothetical protein
MGESAQKIVQSVPVAIPTLYNGVRYRSRTEARWAVFFTHLKLSFEWEPEGYDLGAVRYLPDFLVHSWGIYVEVKGINPTPLEMQKARLLCQASGKGVWIVVGQPAQQHGYFFAPQTNLSRPAISYINRCRRCASLVLNHWNPNEDLPEEWGTHPLGLCGNALVCSDRMGVPEITDHILKSAVDAARNERFGVYDDMGSKGAA